ncbi:MAG: DUF4345 domain-containing protein [Pseudomonadota bacterium]
MIEFYFWFNAIIYFIFAIWCTFKRKDTAVASGYLQLNNSGWSEYLVIYGGLQIGLGLIFTYMALNTIFYKIGLVFAVLLYIPIVLYRVITIFKFRSVKRLTLVIGFMEILLLGGAIILLTVLSNVNHA